MPFVPNYWRVQRPDDLGGSPALSAVVHASDSRTVRLHLVSARSCEPAITVKAVLLGVSLWRRLLLIFRGNTDEMYRRAKPNQWHL